MKPGDLVELSERDGSTTFCLGNLDPALSGIHIPDCSIGIIVRLRAHAVNDESKLDVLVDGHLGWVYLSDCEVVSEASP